MYWFIHKNDKSMNHAGKAMHYNFSIIGHAELLHSH